MRFFMALVIAATLSVFLFAPRAYAVSVQLATSGCAQSHCTPDSSGLAGSPPPLGTVSEQAYMPTQDMYGDPQGSNKGLGCSSNESVVACSFVGPAPEEEGDLTGMIRVYKAAGGTLLQEWAVDSSASKSAPIVLSDGGVIAADRHKLYYRKPGLIPAQNQAIVEVSKRQLNDGVDVGPDDNSTN